MKLNKLILPIISALAIAGCSHLQTSTRDQLLSQLDGTQEGAQSDESVIACSGKSINMRVARAIAGHKVREMLKNHTVTTGYTGFKNEYACDTEDDGVVCCVKANKVE